MICKKNNFVKFISVIWYSFMRASSKFISWNKRFNAVGVTVFRRKLPLIQVYFDINHVIKCTFQRRRCYAFDSPGVPNDSAGYPGLMCGLRGTTP